MIVIKWISVVMLAFIIYGIVAANDKDTNGATKMLTFTFLALPLAYILLN